MVLWVRRSVIPLSQVFTSPPWAVGFAVEPCTGLNIGPSPSLARDAQALARPVYDSLSELPTRAHILFFSSPKTTYTILFQQLEYFSFV